MTTIILGTRASNLARWQTAHVAGALKAAWPDIAVETQVISTKGDRVLDTPLPMVGGKGLFTAELEQALRDHTIDFAVHSLKDLPTDNPDGLVVGAILVRANPVDVLVSRNQQTLMQLPLGARIGTSSLRRAAQLRHHRLDLEIADIRGNVETRLRKTLDDGLYDATLLAHAGLERLEKTAVISQHFDFALMLPAPGQGALAVQCRDEAASLDLLAPLNHQDTRLAVEAERAFLAGLGGGCSVPIAALADVHDGRLQLRGRVTAVDGSQQIDVQDAVGLPSTPTSTVALQLGARLAEAALQQGAAAILEGLGEG